MDQFLDREEADTDDGSTDVNINMDIDDIQIHEVESTTPIVMNDFRPSIITLNSLLKRKATGSKHWTHMVKKPDTYRCCITDIQEAGELYRAVWRYVDQGLAVMEPDCFSVTRRSRLSHNGACPPSPASALRFRWGRISWPRPVSRRTVSCVGFWTRFWWTCGSWWSPISYHPRPCPRASAGHAHALATAFVLRPPPQKGFPCQTYWLHWPGLAICNREFTAEWCLQNWIPGLADVCQAIVPRNTASYVPMYGCAVSADDPPMLVHCVVDEGGDLHHDWTDWLLRTPGLHTVFHIGHQRMWPTVAQLDAARVQRLLPLLTSINPMGTPCVSFLPPRSTACVLNARAEQQRGSVRRILQHLADHRKLSRSRSGEVGQYVFQMSSGADWAFKEWIQWVTNSASRTVDAQQAAELAHEWQMFAHRDTDVDALAVLHEMVRQDNPPEVMTRFLHNERCADHEGRNAPEGMLFGILGSATHHDLAQFIKHELRSIVVCTSMAGNGIWYMYNRDTHRWMFDPEGSYVMIRCLTILNAVKDELRSMIADMPANADGPANRPSGRSPFPVLANFPGDGYNDRDIQKATLVHLDTIVGDVRHMQSVVRYLGKLMMNRNFADQLDVRHEHLIPFTNGVLDLDRRVLRDGRPDDMLLRGPSYPWCDFPASDPDTEELERMLTQVFTETEVLQFFLEVGGTWLRRRNRFKHFYVFTGNTNGGKSLLFNLVKLTFNTLSGLLPIQAITGKDSDASSHSDYLARTHGQAICVCNEPDSSTQMLMPEKVKIMTSDSDHLAVRHLYGTTRDMPITWKLVLLCNTPPMYSQLDDASLQRTQFIPCNSTFVNEADVPATEEEQYRHRRFLRRDIPPARQKELARRLMAMFFAAYCRHGMHAPAYALRPPHRIRLESDRHFQELSVFRMYLRVFLRPCGTINESILSLRANDAVVEAAQRIHMLHEAWLDDADHRARFGWSVEWEDFDDTARDPTVVGSPGWVRCQCVHLFRFICMESGQKVHLDGWRGSRARCLFLPLVIPYIDAAFVADQFNRYRKQQRIYLNRNLSNPSNTFVAPSEQQEQQQQQQEQQSSRGRYQCVSLGTRMRLDRMLVRNVMREVTNTDPDGDRFIGHMFLAPNNRLTSDNDTQTGMMLDRVLALVCRRWLRRFRAPLPHSALVTRGMMQRAVQAVIQRSQYPTVVGEPKKRIRTSRIRDDWDKIICPQNMRVLSDDDEEPEATDGAPPESVMYDLSPQTKAVSAVQLLRSERRQRSFNDIRAHLCVFFPTPNIPEPIVQLTQTNEGVDSHRNPVHWACPKTTNEAESLMIAENFWDSVELKQAIERNRIVRFQPGFAGVHQFPARSGEGDPEEEQETAASLAFYLGPNTRIGLP